MDEQDAFSRKKIIFEFTVIPLLRFSGAKLRKITGIRKPSKLPLFWDRTFLYLYGYKINE